MTIRKRRLKAVMACLLGLSAAGCEFLDLRPDRSAPGEFRRALKPTGLPPAHAPNRFQPPPPVVSDALLPNLDSTKRQSVRESRFDISVMQVDAREFFMGLVADSDYNVIVDPGVSGTISVSLRNVTLAEVLEAVREVYGYDYKKTAAGYIIYPAELMSRIYHIDYLNVIRNGRSETRVSAAQQGGGLQTNFSSPYGGGIGGYGQGGYGGQIGQYGQPGTTAASGGASGGGDELIDCRNLQKSAGSQQAGVPSPSVSAIPGTVIATTSGSNFWKEMKQALSMIVCNGEASKAPEGKPAGLSANFAVNQQSGVLVVRAMAKQLREVEQFLEAIRKESRRQVVMEAKILEVVLSDAYQSGINWSSVIRAGQKSMLTSLSGATAIGDVFTIGVGKGDFTAYIELLETQGEVHTLSSPRIATLNNQKAIIKVGSDEIHIAGINPGSTGTIIGSVTYSSTPIFATFFSGIALDVTPQIDDSGSVTLHVHPSVTQVEDREKNFNLDGQNQSLPLAFNTVRESDSIVHAENGQIVVIGGLMQNQEETSREGVSWLSRIPLLGSLFRRGKGDFRKSELVILLKPMILYDEEDWKSSGREPRDRYKRLEGESRQDPLP
ncbi:MAG: secretin and TonB N-terminal domain-containing protein [Methylococcaceae bacterium]|nr:secretin and TonB N-terminal domain-containing protein [Methylococcaceae bacterium]